MLMEIADIGLTHLFSATALTGEISNRFAFEYAALHLSLKVAASQLHLHEKHRLHLYENIDICCIVLSPFNFSISSPNSIRSQDR